MKGKKWIALLLAAAGMMILAAAGAEAALDMIDPYERHPAFVTWQELDVARDAKLPVYGAPYEDAWRGANGKAAVAAGEGFTLLGTVDDGAWGLVDYTVDGKSRRLGWIRMPEDYARPWIYGDMTLDRTPLKVTRSVTLTDDPGAGKRKIRELKAGEQVIGMFMVTAGNKVYVETQHEGKTVWGLIPADAVEDITKTYLSLEGDTLVIREGVTMIGDTDRAVYDEDDSSDYRTARNVTRILPGDISIGVLSIYSEGGSRIRHLELPDSLRWIGMEGILTGALDEIRLGGGLEIDEYAAYDIYFGRVILARDYTGGILQGQYMSVRDWEVEDGNPLYRDTDGVLFSADGKTLLRYANGREDEHYDVPAGTVEIGDRAFDDDSMDIMLRSISLPAGLKRIGEYAFNGCGYLLSLAVPLTVEEIASSAFSNCVSLERLSLPPGMTAELGFWVKKEDFTTAFRGDNWGTYRKPAEKEEWEAEYDTFRSYSVWLDNPEGSGTVPVYASPTDETPSGTEPAGSRVYVMGITNGRGDIGEDKWVRLENTMNATDDVFFSIRDGEPADPARRTDPAGRPLQYAGIWGGEASFYVEDDASYTEYSFPLRETLLYRERTGKGERMGIIVPEGESAALLDAPGGTKLGHLYIRTQARVLEEADGWIRIETAYGTGWISGNELVIVAEKPETAER